MLQLGFFIACGLLIAGFVLRATIPILGRLFIPASVIGGFIGFALLQIAMRVHPDDRLAQLAAEWKSWPGWLIAVVFAGMLLEKPATTFRQSVRRAAAEGIVVWIIIVGQIALGLAVTSLILRPLFGTAAPFGQLLEVSWAGGFGSSTAWGKIHSALGEFAEAQDLAIFFAAMGLLWGTVSGIVLVNIAARQGWTNATRPAAGDAAARDPAAREPASRDTGVSPVRAIDENRKIQIVPAAYARVPGEIIDPLVFQALILAAAFVSGWLLSAFVNLLAGRIDSMLGRPALLPFLGQLPLFLFTLLGGLMVREIMHALRIGHLIDPLSIRRLVGAAMEFLIVAALASMSLTKIREYALPAAILMLAGAIWCAITLIWLSRKLLPSDYWFELGAINYGMATATTAQGMMLLRMIDPDLKTHAAEDYALAAPLSAPFIGGGVITMVMPKLMQHVGPGWIVIGSIAVVIALYLVGSRVRARRPSGGDPTVRVSLTGGVEQG